MTLRSKTRLLIQCAFAALSNGYLQGYASGKIYTGGLKQLCVPGMNCYSCPGAFASCPIGSLQATIGSRKFNVSLYVFGMLVVFGAFLGRSVCGFLCPFGLLQDLLAKIPFPKKLKRLPGERFLRLLKYVMLFLFAILLPMVIADATGLGDPWFCKYICPVGTLEAGIPLVILNKSLRDVIGFLYAWKIAILAVILVLSLLIWRPFCRYLCPLGALYGFFNRHALYRYVLDESKCTGCGACKKACRMDISVWETPNSPDCVRCGACLDACPAGALKNTLKAAKAQITDLKTEDSAGS